MKKYIFYTAEGVTTAPNIEVEVNNCQLLGFSEGINKTSALIKLLNENPWIEDSGFRLSEIVGVQVSQDV